MLAEAKETITILVVEELMVVEEGFNTRARTTMLLLMEVLEMEASTMETTLELSAMVVSTMVVVFPETMVVPSLETMGTMVVIICLLVNYVAR